MLLSAFRFLATHPRFLIIPFSILMIAARDIARDSDLCTSLANATIPDGRFGYSPDELNRLYQDWGEKGRQAYVRVANTDLFPFMECYTLILGSLLIWASHRIGWKDNIAYLALVIWLSDLGETSLQRLGSLLFPDRLSDTSIRLASLCNQIKWTLVAVAMLVLLGALFVNRSKQVRNALKPT